LLSIRTSLLYSNTVV